MSWENNGYEPDPAYSRALPAQPNEAALRAVVKSMSIERNRTGRPIFRSIHKLNRNTQSKVAEYLGFKGESLRNALQKLNREKAKAEAKAREEREREAAEREAAREREAAERERLAAEFAAELAARRAARAEVARREAEAARREAAAAAARRAAADEKKRIEKSIREAQKKLDPEYIAKETERLKIEAVLKSRARRGRFNNTPKKQGKRKGNSTRRRK